MVTNVISAHCILEKEYIKTMIESRLYRPENTSPCYELFKIDKEQIFINPDDLVDWYDCSSINRSFNKEMFCNEHILCC